MALSINIIVSIISIIEKGVYLAFFSIVLMYFLYF